MSAGDELVVVLGFTSLPIWMSLVKRLSISEVTLYSLGRALTFTKYEIRPEPIEASDQWLLPQRLDLAIGSQVTSWLNLNTSVEFGTSIIRDEDILDGRAPFLGRSIDYEAGFEARPLPSILLGGEEGAARFSMKRTSFSARTSSLRAWVSGI